MALSSSLIAEYIILSKEVTEQQLKKIIKINAIYGYSTLLIFITGLLLWFSVGKTPEYYTSNWLFHTKLTTFILMGILSIRPTIFLLKNKNSTQKTINIPKSVRLLVRIELVLLVIIPLLAVLIANGFGSF
jgi:putative membrane protein